MRFISGLYTASRLKELIVAEYGTLSKFADAHGFHLSDVSRVVNGQKPHGAIRLAIANLAGVSPCEIWENHDADLRVYEANSRRVRGQKTYAQSAQ